MKWYMSMNRWCYFYVISDTQSRAVSHFPFFPVSSLPPNSCQRAMLRLTLNTAWKHDKNTAFPPAVSPRSPSSSPSFPPSFWQFLLFSFIGGPVAGYEGLTTWYTLFLHAWNLWGSSEYRIGSPRVLFVTLPEKKCCCHMGEPACLSLRTLSSFLPPPTRPAPAPFPGHQNKLAG